MGVSFPPYKVCGNNGQQVTSTALFKYASRLLQRNQQLIAICSQLDVKALFFRTQVEGHATHFRVWNRFLVKRRAVWGKHSLRKSRIHGGEIFDTQHDKSFIAIVVKRCLRYGIQIEKVNRS